MNTAPKVASYAVLVANCVLTHFGSKKMGLIASSFAMGHTTDQELYLTLYTFRKRALILPDTEFKIRESSW